MIAAIYARVSTRDKGQDPENQLRELRAYCDRSGWIICRQYVDQASGRSGDRDEFKRMFDDAAQRRFDVVVTWALDRFTRQGIAQTFEYVKRLSDYGVRFESFTEAHFRTTGPAGELMLAVAAWIAKQERERMRERILAGVHKAQGEGTHCGRPRKIFSRERAAELRRQGMSWRDLGREFGVSDATVRGALAQYEAARSEEQLFDQRTESDATA